MSSLGIVGLASLVAGRASRRSSAVSRLSQWLFLLGRGTFRGINAIPRNRQQTLFYHEQGIFCREIGFSGSEEGLLGHVWPNEKSGVREVRNLGAF
jgi:hypothetical protein